MTDRRAQILANYDFILPREYPRPFDLILCAGTTYYLRLIGHGSNQIYLSWGCDDTYDVDKTLSALLDKALYESSVMVTSKLDGKETPRHLLTVEHESMKKITSRPRSSGSSNEDETGQSTPTATSCATEVTPSSETASSPPDHALLGDSYLESVSTYDLHRLSSSQLVQLDAGLHQLLRFLLDHVQVYVEVRETHPIFTTGDLSQRFASRLAKLLQEVDVRYDRSLTNADTEWEILDEAYKHLIKEKYSDEERIHALRCLTFTLPYRIDGDTYVQRDEAKKSQMRMAVSITINLCYWRGIFPVPSSGLKIFGHPCWYSMISE